MFKVAVVAFALAVSGFMLWVGHENSNFAPTASRDLRQAGGVTFTIPT